MGCGGSVAVRPLAGEIEECSEYVVGDLLGSGQFGQVYAATSTVDQKEWAIKVMASTEAATDEIAFMRAYGSHPNIVGLRETFHVGTRVCLTLELVGGGELFAHCTSHAHDARRCSSIVTRVHVAL